MSFGSDAYGRALFANSFSAGPGSLLAAIDLRHDDGPYDRPENFEVARGLLRYSLEDSGNQLSFTAMGYDGSLARQRSDSRTCG